MNEDLNKYRKFQGRFLIMKVFSGFAGRFSLGVLFCFWLIWGKSYAEEPFSTSMTHEMEQFVLTNPEIEQNGENDEENSTRPGHPDRTYEHFEEELPLPPPMDDLLEGLFDRSENDFFLNDYRFEGYTRISQEMNDDPFPLLDFDLDTAFKDVFYLQETHSEFYGNDQDGYTETVLGTRVSGDDRAVSKNYLFNEPLDPRKRVLHFSPYIERGLIAPLSRFGSFFYEFEFEESFLFEDETIHAIRVSPRRNHYPTFEGMIYVIDESWELLGLELEAEPGYQNGLLDYVQMEWWFTKHNDVWVPETQIIEFNAERNGFSYTGAVRSHFMNFEKAEETEVADFQVNVLDEAIWQPYSYWNEMRPFELTDAEKADYQWRDSLYFLRNNEEFLDSADKARNQNTYKNFLWKGYRWQNSHEGQEVFYHPLVTSLFFNPVEGWGLQATVDYSQVLDDRPDLEVGGFIRYGEGLGRFYGGIELQQGNLSAAAGRSTREFNQSSPVNEHVNSLYSLVSSQNYRKLYEESYLKSSYEYPWRYDLIPFFEAAFAQRDSLINTKTEGLGGNNFIPNNPWNFLPQEGGSNPARERFSRHEKLSIEAGVKWQPFRKRALYPDSQEVVIGQGHTEFEVGYRKTIAGDFMDVDYDFVHGNMQGSFRLGMIGSSTWKLAGGAFLRNSFLPYMDRHHFNGNQTLLRQEADDGFQVLDYYEFSTNEQFVSGHLNHSFNGFIMNKLPLLRELPASVVVSGNSFYLPENDNHYWEASAGLENIAGIFRIDYVRGYLDGGFYGDGVRIGIEKPFPGFSVR